MLDVFDTNKVYYAFYKIEQERKSLLTNHTKININDLGAGSLTTSHATRTISNIAINVVSNEYKCRMLFNLVNKYLPKNIIELGTSLGISSLYISMASKYSNVYTIEGDKEIYNIANNLFQKNHITNIKNINASFDEALPKILNEIPTVNMAYIDGNHSYEATMRYYNMLKSKSNNNTILVFDDIYWSDGMTKAWKDIINKDEVRYSIDTFDLGFVFFDDVMPKQHFKLIQYWKKPWRIGLWG
jgi:predicted O-methyltransferase YrrM